MSVSVYNNERSLAEDIAITWDAKCKAKSSWKIKALGAEISINAIKENHEKGRNGMNFPDLVLYGSTSKTPMSILQMWELKCPDVSLSDKTLLSQAVRKANYLGLQSTLIWNFQFGELYVKDVNTNEFTVMKKWEVHPEIKISNRLEALEFVDNYKSDIDAVIDDMFVTVNSYLSLGRIPKRCFTFEGAEFAIQSIINDNKADVAEKLRYEVRKNAITGAQINNWWSVAEMDYSSDESDMYVACGKQTILNWLQKLLFANIIKSVYPKATDVEKITGVISIQDADDIFKDITAHIDFFTMFAPTEFSLLLPSNTWSQIVEFNTYIVEEGIPVITTESLQAILDTTVTSMKRNVTGLYSEKPSLAEILVGITMIDATKTAIDPCCGTGTISRKIIDNKLQRGESVSSAYNSTWACDYNSFPLQVAVMAMTSSESINIPTIVFRQNLFDLHVGNIIKITNPKDGSKLNYKVPQFDYIISNLPFVDFNTVNTTVFSNQNKLDIISDVKNNTGVVVDQKKDVFAFMLFYIWNLLSDDGRIGVIISNSWLKGTNKNFFDALTHYYSLEGIYISNSERWFDNAEVITNLLIAKKKKIIKRNSKDNVVFGRILPKLSTIHDSSVISGIINDILLKKNSDNVEMHSHNLEYIDELLQHGLSLNYLFYDNGWIKNVLQKTIPISNLFSSSRGLKSCCDKVFYTENPDTVDPVYLQGILSNSKAVNSLVIHPDKFVIVCDDNISTLRKNGYDKTADYFIQKKSIALHSKSAMSNADTNERNNHPWYSPFAWKLDDKYVDVVIPLNGFERMFCSKLSTPSLVNQRFTAFKARKNVNVDLCHALLNSTFSIFVMEAGANPMGSGALDNNSTTLQALPMLNPDLLTSKQKDDILTSFEPLLHRPILSVKEELEMSDRKEFDKTVMKAFGIEMYYDNIKDELLKMMYTRLYIRNHKG